MHLGSNFKSDENSDEKFLGNSKLSNTDPKALGSGEAMAGNNRSNPYDQSSYDQVPPPGNPTYSEAWALVEAARRMAAPLEYGAIDDPENLRKIRDGLRLNWRLWTIFQTELSLEEASVPENIRENMLSLCHFVDLLHERIKSRPSTCHRCPKGSQHSNGRRRSRGQDGVHASYIERVHTAWSTRTC